MSYVSGVVLTCSVCEDDGPDDHTHVPAIEAINAWLVGAGGQSTGLLEMSQHTGGHKHPQILIYGGGFNYLDEIAFADLVKEQPWQYPANVCLIINPEEGPPLVTQLFGMSK